MDFREPTEHGYYIPHSSQDSSIFLLKQNILNNAATNADNVSVKQKNKHKHDIQNPTAFSVHSSSGSSDDDDDDSDEDSDEGEFDNKSNQKQNNSAPATTVKTATCTLFVHLPYDHLQRLDVTLAVTCTLADVFEHVKRHIPYFQQSQLFQGQFQEQHKNVMIKCSDYHFFEWENGRLETRPVQGIPAPTISEDSSKFTEIKDDEIPHPMKFGVLADCSIKPLSMNLKVSQLNTLRIRLCHVMEWNVYLQVCSVERHVVDKRDSVLKRSGTTSSSSAPSSSSGGSLFTGMFKSKTNYVYTTPFFSFDGDVPFNPPRLLGSGVSCFNIRSVTYTYMHIQIRVYRYTHNHIHIRTSITFRYFQFMYAHIHLHICAFK